MSAVQQAAVATHRATELAWVAYTEARDAAAAAWHTYGEIRSLLFEKYNGAGPDDWGTADRDLYDRAEKSWSDLSAVRELFSAAYEQAANDHWAVVSPIAS